MCIVSVCGSIKQLTLCCRRLPQSKPIEILLLFGYGRSLIDQTPDIWSIRGSSSIKTKAYLVLVDAVAKIFLLFRPTQRIMTCNDPQLQLAWYLVDVVAMLLSATGGILDSQGMMVYNNTMERIFAQENITVNPNLVIMMR